MANDDVCYRHPDRQSWTLCERCGRTICPECQLATPNGIYCPDCVRETSGADVAWVSTSSRATKSNVTPIRRKKTRRSTRQSPQWWQQLKRSMVPDDGGPLISWWIAGALVVVFIANAISNNVLFFFLAAFPTQQPWELWRFFTSVLVTPFVGLSWLSLLINLAFFLLIAPRAERMLGRSHFVAVLLAGIGAGSAAMLLGGFAAYGITGALYGIFGAYFVIARSNGAPTGQFIVALGINVLITLVLSPPFLFMIAGGLIGGGGAAWLFAFHSNRNTRSIATPYWQIAGSVGALILLAVLRSALLH